MLVFIIIILAKQAEMELFGNLQAMQQLVISYFVCYLQNLYN